MSHLVIGADFAFCGINFISCAVKQLFNLKHSPIFTCNRIGIDTTHIYRMILNILDFFDAGVIAQSIFMRFRYN